MAVHRRGGVVDGAFVEALWKNRLYPIAASVLRFDREKVLTVRIVEASHP